MLSTNTLLNELQREIHKLKEENNHQREIIKRLSEEADNLRRCTTGDNPILVDSIISAFEEQLSSARREVAQAHTACSELEGLEAEAHKCAQARIASRLCQAYNFLLL